MIDIDDCTVQGSVNDLTGDELYQSQQIDESVFIDPSVWGEVKSAVDGLLKQAIKEHGE